MGAQGQTAEVTITDLSHRGEGIGRLDGSVVVVAGALPGDRVRIRLAGRRRSLWQADLVAVVEPSPQRRRPPCILADHCGGCSLQPLQDAAQADWKEQQVRQTLLRVGGIDAEVRPILRAPQPLGYRNRAVIPLERTADGVLRAGYYRRGSHQIVNLNHCPVLDPRIDALITPLKSDLEAQSWPVDRHGGGGLRHLALRVGEGSGEVLITLVATSPDLPGLEALAHSWMRRWPELVGVGLNLQTEPTNRLLGEHTASVAGRSWLVETFCGLDYRIAADTFFQVNTSQAEAVVPLLLEGLGPEPGHLIDAYCGIGTYSLPLADRLWRVLGIEQHPGAVELARQNASLAGLDERCTFCCDDVGGVLLEHLQVPGVDALFLDPPRKGLAPAVLTAIRQAAPPRLLYLSCDPATLARDLAQLCADGLFRVAWLQPIDFFPNTSHVEALAVLEHAQA